MTILITGATGLVGARLLPRLVEAGMECRALMRAGKRPPPGVVGVEGDLLDPSTLAHAVTGISAVVHLAAVFRTADEEMIWKTNLEGTCNLIAAVKANASDARFIMASTSLVYDRGGAHPGREDDATDPKQAYPASKIAAENALRASGLNWSIQRFAFVYGDGDGHLESLPKLATGAGFHPAQRMSMVHHRDIAAATIRALGGAMDGRIVNLVDDAPTSIHELAELVGEPMNPSSEPLTHPWYLQAEGALARSLGLEPTVRTVYQARSENLL